MRTEATRLIAVLAILSATLAASQAAAGPGTGVANYDPKTEATVKGTVEKVNQYASRGGRSGTHLLLKTGSGTLDVHVGPTDYISQQEFSFAPGDQIEVTGSKVEIGGQQALLAREIRKDGKVLTLRNAQGIPAWSRGRRRPM